MFGIILLQDQEILLVESRIKAMLRAPERFWFRCADCGDDHRADQSFNRPLSLTDGRYELICRPCKPGHLTNNDERLYSFIRTLQRELEAYMGRQAELDRRYAREIERQVRMTGVKLIEVQPPKRDPVRARELSRGGWNMLQQSA